ncbi:MAG: hypothetical protein LBG20_00355 [Holosporaceae bacterium]|jgi:hypothetical protein|nr:hypothetical protein [Holosporaceae bacterium]
MKSRPFLLTPLAVIFCSLCNGTEASRDLAELGAFDQVAAKERQELPDLYGQKMGGGAASNTELDSKIEDLETKHPRYTIFHAYQQNDGNKSKINETEIMLICQAAYEKFEQIQDEQAKRKISRFSNVERIEEVRANNWRLTQQQDGVISFLESVDTLAYMMGFTLKDTI